MSPFHKEIYSSPASLPGFARARGIAQASPMRQQHRRFSLPLAAAMLMLGRDIPSHFPVCFVASLDIRTGSTARYIRKISEVRTAETAAIRTAATPLFAPIFHAFLRPMRPHTRRLMRSDSCPVSSNAERCLHSKRHA